MVDFQKYAEWFLVEGSARQLPLMQTTLEEDRVILQRLERRGVDLASLTVTEAKAFLVREKQRGLANGSVNNVSKALRRWLRFRDGADVRLPTWKEDDPEEKALTREQKWLSFGYTHADRATEIRAKFILAFALASGVEPGEAAPMNVDDVDLERGGVHVRFPVKGHKKGFVPLPANVLTNPRRPSFQTWLRHRPVPKGDPNALFVLLRRGPPRRMTPASLSAVLQDIQAQTGVRVNWQVTRHTCGTDLLEAGYGERYVMKHLRLTSLAHLPRYAEARAPVAEAKYRRLTGIDPFGGA